MAERKVIDEVHKISDKKGNGQLRREVCADVRTERVTRYNLAYINHRLYQHDNVRVLGYDNAHDGHHRHWFGQIEPVQFECFEQIEVLFEQDWLSIKDAP